MNAKNILKGIAGGGLTTPIVGITVCALIFQITNMSPTKLVSYLDMYFSGDAYFIGLMCIPVIAFLLGGIFGAVGGFIWGKMKNNPFFGGIIFGNVSFVFLVLLIELM